MNDTERRSSRSEERRMKTTALRAGLRRGRIELRQALTSPQDLWNFVGLPLMAVVVMLLLRGNGVPGTGFSLGSQAIPGILGMHVAFAGMLGTAMTLVAEREDGTLLRAKATPDGMVGYLVGKVVSVAGTTTAGLLIVLVPAALLFDGLELGRPGSWLTLAWVLALRSRGRKPGADSPAGAASRAARSASKGCRSPSRWRASSPSSRPRSASPSRERLRGCRGEADRGSG